MLHKPTKTTYFTINFITIDQLTSYYQFSYSSCKVEFNQPFCWLYFVPNLLIFQQLVTLYLGGLVVRVVSEIEC